MSISKSLDRRKSLLWSSSAAAASLFAGVAGLSALTAAPGVALAADECGNPSANGATNDVLTCVAGPYAVIDYSTTTNGNLELRLQDGVTVTTSGIVITGKAGEAINVITTTTVPNAGDISIANAAGSAIAVSGQGSVVNVDLRTDDTGDAPSISGLSGINAVNTVGATEVHMNGGTVTTTNGVGVNAKGVTDVDVTLSAGTVVNAAGGYAVIADTSAGDASIVAGGIFTGTGGVAAIAGGAGNASVLIQSGATAAATDNFSYGAFAQATGSGNATVELHGDVINGGVGVFAGGGTASLTGAGSTAMTGAFDGAEVSTNSGNINVDLTGNLTAASADGVDTFSATGTTTIVLGGTVTGGDNGVEATSNSGDISATINGSALGGTNGVFVSTGAAASVFLNGTASGGNGVSVQISGVGDAIDIAVEGDVTGQTGDGIHANHSAGGPVSVTIGAAGSVTSNGLALDHFGIDIGGGPGTLIVAGTVNGGAGGAIRFGNFANRLELMSTFAINGLVVAGTGGSDTLAFGGSSGGAFDLTAIDPGNNTRQYRGFENFVVDDAAWDFSGATTAGFTVNSGGTLGGNGTFGGIIVNAGGTLSPGNSIGTVTVNGNLSFAAGSTYQVEVSTTDADRTNVTGTAALDGAVVVSYLPGTYIARSYTILHANGGLGGTTFDTLTAATLPGLETSLKYAGGDVLLVTAVKDEPEEPEDPDLKGLTLNEKRALKTILDYFRVNGKLPAEFATLDDDTLNLVTGELSTGTITAGILAADKFLDMLSDPSNGAYAASNAGAPIAYADQPDATASSSAIFAKSLATSSKHSADAVEAAFASRWKVWGGAYGGATEIEGEPVVIGSADIDTRVFGLAGGIERAFGNGAIGMALGGGRSSFELAGGLGSGDIGTFNAGVYVNQSFDNLYVAGGLAYGFHSVDTSRTVPGATLRAGYDAHSFSGRAEVGYRLDTPVAMIAPYAAFQAINYRMPGYSETGGVFALDYARSSTTATRIELGARAEHPIALGNGTVLKLTGRAAWAINGGTERRAVAAFPSLAGAPFIVDGASPSRHAALIDAGAEFDFGNNLAAAVTFQGEFSSNVTSYGAKGKLSYRW